MKLALSSVLALIFCVLLGACSPDGGETASDRLDTAERATRGLDPALMEAVVGEAEQLSRLHALVVARHGEILAEHRFSGPELDQPVNIKSASKSVISALAGISIGRGTLEGTEQKIAPILRSEVPADADPRVEAITVGHLLSMQAGLERTSGANYGSWVTSANWVRYALSRPFVAEPGGRMLYSTGSTHLVSAVLTKASGRSTHDLAQTWLAEPLGITIPRWSRDPQGIYFGGNEMLMSPRDLLRFGELYRQDGIVGERRILPEGWVDESWEPRTSSPWSGNDYGYGWFIKEARGHDVYFAWGYGGQMLFVVPELALTVVMISDSTPHPRAERHLPQLHAILDDGIIPAAQNGNETQPITQSR